MLIDLPTDIQGYVFDIYKTGLRERHYDCTRYYIDMIHASCGEKADVLIDYMRDLVRHPSSKPHFALVLTGDFANAVSTLMCRVVGEANCVVGDGSLLGRFNGRLLDKTLVVLNGTPTADTIGKVKDLVASPTVVIEERRRNAVKVPSHHRVVMVSPTVASDGGRRLCTIECRPVAGFEAEKVHGYAALRQHLATD